MLEGDSVNEVEKLEINEVGKQMSHLQEICDNLIIKVKEIDDIIQETFIDQKNPAINGRISKNFLKAWNDNLPDLKQLESTFQFWQENYVNICSMTTKNNEEVVHELQNLGDDLVI